MPWQQKINAKPSPLLKLRDLKRKSLSFKEREKEFLDFTGMEYAHVDVTEMARDFQYDLYWRIFHKQDYKKFVIDYIEKLKKEEFDDKLVYTKNMTKKEADYVSITPPHVKAARILMQHGIEIPSAIQYVITVDGPRPVEVIDQPLDYDHYIEKQIKPIAEEVFVFLKENFEELIKDKKQKSLKEYYLRYSKN